MNKVNSTYLTIVTAVSNNIRLTLAKPSGVITYCSHGAAITAGTSCTVLSNNSITKEAIQTMVTLVSHCSIDTFKTLSCLSVTASINTWINIATTHTPLAVVTRQRGIAIETIGTGLTFMSRITFFTSAQEIIERIKGTS